MTSSYPINAVNLSMDMKVQSALQLHWNPIRSAAQYTVQPGPVTDRYPTFVQPHCMQMVPSAEQSMYDRQYGWWTAGRTKPSLNNTSPADQAHHAAAVIGVCFKHDHSVLLIS